MKFLSLEKEIFGMDISDMSVKIIKLKKQGKMFSLTSYNEVEVEQGVIEKGVIQNEEVLVKIIKKACKTVQGKSLKTKYAAVSLPEEKSFLQVIQMPIMEYKELKSAVLFEAENYIPLPLSEVYLDFEPIFPINEKLDHIDVLIGAMPKKIVNSYMSCLQKAGLTPVIFEIESQAIARALIKDEVTTVPIVLIDFGRDNTDFIVYAGKSVHFTVSLPVSSQQITSAIAQSLGITQKRAETIKMNFDISSFRPDPKNYKIYEAIKPILEEMCLQIKKYVNFYQDHASHEHLPSSEGIKNIYLCGGGAHLKGLAEYLSEKLGLSVELGNFWTNLPTKLRRRMIRQNALTFVTALGLALGGMQQSQKNYLY